MRGRGLSREKVDMVNGTVNPAENGKHELYSKFPDSSQQKTGNWIVLVVLREELFSVALIPLYILNREIEPRVIEIRKVALLLKV